MKNTDKKNCLMSLLGHTVVSKWHFVYNTKNI